MDLIQQVLTEWFGFTVGRHPYLYLSALLLLWALAVVHVFHDELPDRAANPTPTDFRILVRALELSLFAFAWFPVHDLGATGRFAAVLLFLHAVTPSVWRRR